MRIKYFRQSKLDALRSNILGNLPKYESSDSWLQDYFANDPYYLETEILGEGLPELKMPDENDVFDLDNSIALHRSLRGLTREQASSERLWAILAHDLYWKYMRVRWPIEDPTGGKRSQAAGYIREHYFFMPNRHRALVRNGIARLWWYGSISYDSRRSNKYELTPLLLATLDIAQSLLERAFSSNENIAKGVLLALEAWKNKNGSPPSREYFRESMKHMTRVGGVQILDALEIDEIQNLVLIHLDKKQGQQVKANA